MNIFYSFKSLFVMIILSLVWLVFSQIQTYATNIRLGIYNSYQWSITIQPWEHTVQFWWNTRTNENTLWIIIWASTGSAYTITGISPTISTIWSGIYQHNHNITLQSTDWAQTIYGSFIRNTEPYSTNLNIMIDRSAPSSAFLLQPISNTIISGDITLSRSPSIDNGIGLSHYKIHLSLDAWFLGETILITSGTSLVINTNNLPIWTLFWYVESIDYLWNSSNSSASFFHHQTYSTIDENPSDGGWGGIVTTTGNNNNIITNTWNQNTNTWNQTWTIIQSGSILSSWTIIDSNTTWNNIIIIQPEVENQNNTPTIVSSWDIIDNNISNESIKDNEITNISNKKDNWWSSDSEIYNYIIVSNSIDNNSLSIKEYLINQYQSLSLSQKWNLIIPDQNIITINNWTPNQTTYTNLIKKQYLRQEPWIYKAITYVVQQKNPVYYVVQVIEYSLSFIEKLYILLGL